MCICPQSDLRPEQVVKQRSLEAEIIIYDYDAKQKAIFPATCFANLHY